MIFTVLTAAADDAQQWQAALLEYSWGRAKQPGELVQMTAGQAPNGPRRRLAHVVETAPWAAHPYTGDTYPPYDTAASVLEWLFTEHIEGTVLLLEPDSLFRAAWATEVGPSGARATAWSGLPSAGTGPFGLGSEFAFLDRFCVNRELALTAVRLPVLIEARELRRLAPRWLELMSIVRAELPVHVPARADADKIAYAIAAAEAGVAHTAAALAVGTEANKSAAPILDYRRPVESRGGEQLWDTAHYAAEAPPPARAHTRIGRELLTLLQEFAARTAEGGSFAFLRPCRRKGVREGRVLDQTLLAIPGRADTLSLNPSAAEIWGLCDGTRSLADLTHTLEGRFRVSRGSLLGDVQTVIDRLEGVGAIELAPL